MANTISTIFDNLKAQVAATVDASFLQLTHPRQLEKNDSRVLTKGWGLRFLDGPSTDTITKAYTIDQGFELILTRTNLRQENEVQVEDAEKLLFDEATDIMLPLINTNIGLTVGVSKVSAPSFSEPELVNDASFVALRVQFTVTYRQQL